MEYPFIEDRKKRLAAFNKILKERKLKPLTKLGDSRIKGETELLRILKIYNHYKNFGTDVEFETKDWTKKPGQWLLRWTANSLESDGNIFVIIVNEHYLFSKQHRPTMGKWKKGLPRGWHRPLPKRSSKKKLFQEIQISDLPMDTLLRELGEEVIKAMDVMKVTHLGKIASNDGIETGTPDYWLIRVEVTDSVLEKRLKEISHEGVKIVLMTKEEMETDIGKPDGISDALSITGIHLAKKYLNQK